MAVKVETELSKIVKNVLKTRISEESCLRWSSAASLILPSSLFTIVSIFFYCQKVDRNSENNPIDEIPPPKRLN